jgi:hypothetical protein
VGGNEINVSMVQTNYKKPANVCKNKCNLEQKFSPPDFDLNDLEEPQDTDGTQEIPRWSQG